MANTAHRAGEPPTAAAGTWRTLVKDRLLSAFLVLADETVCVTEAAGL